MLKHDSMIFFVALFFLFILWVATGGPSRPISWAGPFLNAPAPLGSGKAYFLSGAGFGIGSSSVSFAGFSIGESSGSLSNGSGSTLDTSAYFTNPSPYRNEIRFESSPSGAEQQLAAAENLTVRVSGSLKAPVDVTGWELVSNSSHWALPQGTTLPTTGSVNSVSDIVLNPGDTAIIVSGASPVGVSFRENECTGYLNQYQSFHPSLDASCPSPYQVYTNVYGSNDQSASVSECQSYIDTLSRCAAVTNFPVDNSGNQEVSNSCQAFVTQHFTYNGCVADNEGSAGFVGTTWRIYLGSRAGLWNDNHDTIRLLDAQGKTVDVFAY